MDNFAIYTVFCGHSRNRSFTSQPADPRFRHFFVSNNHEILEEATALGWIPVLLDLEVNEDEVVSAAQSKIAKADPHRIGELRA